MQLSDLPDEILLKILLSLCLKDLLAFSKISHRTHGLYKNSTRLQYNVELEASGCQDISLDAQAAPWESQYANESINDRLRYLRERETRWRELNLQKKSAKITLPDNVTLEPYDLTAGVFVYGERVQDSGLTFLDLREVSRRSEAVRFAPGANKQLDLPTSDVPWQFFPFEGHLADFGMALEEHDLIALVSINVRDETLSGQQSRVQDIRLHLYCFSTHEPHPRAKEPVIKLAEKPSNYNHSTPIIEAVGKYIVVLLTFPAAHRVEAIEDLFVYNWQSGLLIAHHTYIKPTYCTLSFVTASLFVMPNLQDNALDLVHICTSSDNVEQICWLRKLRLPELVKGFEFIFASCRGDPNPMESTLDCMNKTQFQAGAAGRDVTRNWSASGYGISADPLKSIMTFNLTFARGRFFGPVANLVLHRNVLACLALESLERLEFLPEGGGESSMETTTWEDWGLGTTRWRTEDQITDWITTTSGQRQAFTTSSYDRRKLRVIVRDFNPYAVRRTKLSGVAMHVDSRDGKRDTEDEVVYRDIEVHEGDFEEDNENGNEGQDGHGEGGGGGAEMDELDMPMDEDESEDGTNVAVHVDKLSEGSSTNVLRRPIVHIRDTGTDFVARYYRNGIVRSELPCVEYALEGDKNILSGLLMDEERIIGYLEDAYENVVQMAVFSMHP